MTGRSLELRTQILLTLLIGAILPLGIVGIWLTSNALRSGETLLRSHLDSSADKLAAAIETRWQFRRADIDLIVGNTATADAVRGGMTAADSGYLRQLAIDADRTIPVIELRDTAGKLVWSSTPESRLLDRRAHGDLTANAGAVRTPPGVLVQRAIVADGGRRLGTVTVDVALTALLPADSARPVFPGAQIAVRSVTSAAVLLPLSSRMNYPDSTRVAINGSIWLVTHRTVGAPALQLAMAAPLAPYVDPFSRAASVGVAALLAVSVVSIILVAVLATRATRPLRELVAASDAVTRGTLDQRVVTRGPTEVRQLGHAFNVMTGNLRDTVDQLSRRNAFAAVGEFATSLSHDVRNALTAIKVDLERAARRDIPDPVTHGLVSRALNNVSRLESVVSGALRVARRGHAPAEDVDLREVLEEAAATVRATFAEIPAVLHQDLGRDPVLVRGDRAALQQLFANLLFNAAQALRPGGDAKISVVLSAEQVDVLIADSGAGISTENLRNIERPFFSSKHDGTGLGLPIARQIAAAHGGELTIESAVDQGTVVRVQLLRVHGSFDAIERGVPFAAVASAADE